MLGDDSHWSSRFGDIAWKIYQCGRPSKSEGRTYLGIIDNMNNDLSFKFECCT